ncbi:ChrR family anti-sigma-E factor [Devosia sp. MC1541]|uniref:ChrR family anti-sigma-E factor n=1 Tax=Devosia sp. MC1541 TaxID=2725264 RepID=UPI00145E2846|nr:ChrR family anti-sigma-E factor [Devosia sp. MC1541]
MSLHHHTSEALLLDYASGNLAEGWSLAIATHLAMCPECRQRLDIIEATAGALLAEIAPVAGPADAWESFAERLEVEPAPRAAKPVRDEQVTVGEIPQPLRDYVGRFDQIKWKRVGNAHQVILPINDGETMVRLLRIPAGKPVPEHSHGGRELTLVLQGSFHDEVDRFGPGDLEEADGSLTHQPIAGTDMDCICLAVTDAPLKFSSRLVRFMQPYLGI